MQYLPSNMTCPLCGSKPLNPKEARYCTNCGVVLSIRASGASKAIRTLRLLALPFIVVARAVAYPIRKRRERIRWLREANESDSPINRVAGLSDGAKSVYSFLAGVTFRYGSSHSRIRTIASVTRLSENKTRAAIRELERRNLLWHRRRNTWHGRGAHDYHVRPVERDRG